MWIFLCANCFTNNVDMICDLDLFEIFFGKNPYCLFDVVCLLRCRCAMSRLSCLWLSIQFQSL